jgi:hypothetical protein
MGHKAEIRLPSVGTLSFKDSLNQSHSAEEQSMKLVLEERKKFRQYRNS